MQKFDEAFKTCNEVLEYLLTIHSSDQHEVHGDNTVEEPEREVVKLLGGAGRLLVERGGLVHRGQQPKGQELQH